MSAENCLRESLVTKFACATCGKRLNLSYRPVEGASKDPGMAREEPTGAAMVCQVVYVEPCYTCLEPVREVQSALKSFAKLAAIGSPK